MLLTFVLCRHEVGIKNCGHCGSPLWEEGCTFFILHSRRAKGYTVDFGEFCQVDGRLLRGFLRLVGTGNVVVTEMFVNNLLERYLRALLEMVMLLLLLIVIKTLVRNEFGALL